jgi:hypothetical protein
MKKGLTLMLFLVLIVSSLIMVIPEYGQSAVTEVTLSGVAFRETGLPNGTLWAVNCNGTQYQSANPDISITLPPGTYTFYVPDISGYTVFPQNGTVTAILDPIKLNDITFSLSSPPPTSTPIPTASPSPTPLPSESPTSSPSPSIPEFPIIAIALVLIATTSGVLFYKKMSDMMDEIKNCNKAIEYVDDASVSINGFCHKPYCGAPELACYHVK